MSRLIGLPADILAIRRRKASRPISVTFWPTYRCNSRCTYCTLHEKNEDELTTREIIRILDQFFTLGTQHVNLDGGECLLRDDIGLIVDHIRKSGRLCSMNTNGILLRKSIHKIRDISWVKLSLDGPEDINDASRMPGMYRHVSDAIDACRKERIRVIASTVISKHNVDHFSEVMQTLRMLHVESVFQPATSMEGDDPASTRNQSPDPVKYKAFIGRLIEQKRKGNPHIKNSIVTLRHLHNWPAPTWLECYAGLAFVYVLPSGRINPCGRLMLDDSPSLREHSVSEALDIMMKPKGCSHCWCSNLAEPNLLLSMHPKLLMSHVLRI